MGKLLRKKPAAKKKKKKADDGALNNAESGAADKKIVSLTDFSKDKNKDNKKSVESKAKPVKASDGKLEKAKQFLREVRVELKKVTWPSRTQTIGSTAVVILLVLILSVFLGVVDAGLSKLVQLVLH